MSATPAETVTRKGRPSLLKGSRSTVRRTRSATLSAALRRSLRKEHGELFAAVPAGQIARTHGGLEDSAESADRHVSGAMAVGVVEALEMVEVEERHGQGSAVTAMPRPLLRESGLEVSARGEPGELVGDGDLPVAGGVERRRQRREQRADLALARLVDRLGRGERQVRHEHVPGVEREVELLRRLGAGEQLGRRERAVGLGRGELEQGLSVDALAQELVGGVAFGQPRLADGRGGRENPDLVDASATASTRKRLNPESGRISAAARYACWTIWRGSGDSPRKCEPRSRACSRAARISRAAADSQEARRPAPTAARRRRASAQTGNTAREFSPAGTEGAGLRDSGGPRVKARGPLSGASMFQTGRWVTERPGSRWRERSRSSWSFRSSSSS